MVPSQIITVLLLFVLWISGPVQAESIQLPIGTSEFAPFEYSQEGQVVGADSDLIRAILESMGYEPDIQIMPWARALNQAKRGKLAAIFSLTKNPEREAVYLFSDPINQVKDVFFKRTDRVVQWQSFSDLARYRIGVGKGYVYAPEFMQALAENVFSSVFELTGNNLEYRQLKQLQDGKIDLVVCEVSVCSFLLNQRGGDLSGIDYIDKPIGEIRPYYIAFSRNWPNAKQIVAEFNQALKQYIQQGKQKALFERYHIQAPQFPNSH